MALGTALPSSTQYRKRLRSRIIFSFLFLGLGLTTLFAGAVLTIYALLETQLLERNLQNEVDAMVSQVHANPDEPPAFSIMEGWAKSSRTIGNMPMAWQQLPSGVHDMREPDASGEEHVYKLAVRRQGDIIGFIRFDVSRGTIGIDRLTIMVLLAVAVFSLLAWLIGVWSSQRVMRPVADLADRLEAYDGSAPEREPLAQHFADDEVGQLALAFDHYADQLTERVTRDREFNADVSHELRTPLSVISGAVELMAAAPDVTPRTLQRLERIQRATQQSTDTITALLMLSRNERGSGSCNVRKVIGQVIQAQSVHVKRKPVTLFLADGDEGMIDAPEAVLSVALSNLIGNACRYTDEGEVQVIYDAPHTIRIIDSGIGIDPHTAETLFERGNRGKQKGNEGAGIGLAIVSRLCHLYGWAVQLSPRTDAQGTVATLELNPDQTNAPPATLQ